MLFHRVKSQSRFLSAYQNYLNQAKENKQTLPPWKLFDADPPHSCHSSVTGEDVWDGPHYVSPSSETCNFFASILTNILKCVVGKGVVLLAKHSGVAWEADDFGFVEVVMYFGLDNIVAHFFEGNFGGEAKLGANMLTINEFLIRRIS